MCILYLTGCEKKVADQQAEYPTPFEEGDGNTTATYGETIDFYIRLAREYPEINIQTLGMTDSGKPLHLVTYSPEGDFNFERLRREHAILLVLNGIHPGESDGIDASMLLLRDLATGALRAPENVVIATIPVYNVGGALQRNSTTRANQNGPESYGFRGNARNYDLNRDFLKMDTRNARTFAQIFHLVRPDFFLDNHVSNGADYSYTLTHLFTQHNKLGSPLGEFLEDSLRLGLEASLAERQWDITPYVNVFNRPPETGFSQFMDYPRYSTGYAALWNTPGMMLETHMLKPYDQRVSGTYAVMESLIGLVSRQREALREKRRLADSSLLAGRQYPLGWSVDSTRYQTLDFKGYTAEMVPSEVTGQPRLKYDRERPVAFEVPYYNEFRPADSIRIPKAYIVPRQWQSVSERLDWNGIRYRELEKDTALQVTGYRIEDYSTYDRAYEGHYPHYATRVSADTVLRTFAAGDLLVPTDQPGIRYILETLEPAAPDSFFNWNFFDTVLQQKEGFSPYVFEETAARLLESDSTLRHAFQRMRDSVPGFADSGYRQLDWLYMHSPNYEPAHRQYPVYRME
ncbi:M14 family metallopeptidase [Robiginitalea sp. SC105]|uniref:M14 family metallopeptidase n=1 Tax=Robiginitalea sp. SC105 TaxID=2762332 RepID=UPI0021079400|nr:M14 family metallopeptidase [Robiginitalea sp. SC105]